MQSFWQVFDYYRLLHFMASNRRPLVDEREKL